VTVAPRFDGVGRHRHSSRLLAAILVLAQLAIVAIALSAPLYFAWLRSQAEQLGLQHGTRETAAPPIQDRLSTKPALLVVSFHNLEPNPHSPYSLTPRAFDVDMHTLVAAGYTSATAADVDAALAGHPPSGHKVLITFDDGARGIWTYADRILARYRLHAMAFIITGQVGAHQPYYVTWPELRAMHRSGRWDLESHTHLGHGLITSSPIGGKGAFLAGLQWLPALHRHETISEYESRVRNDLTESRFDMIAHGLPAPHFLAYPFSATGYLSKDKKIPSVLRRLVGEQFVAAFNSDNDDAGAITSHDATRRLIPRIEVTGQMPPLTLLARLRRASPLTVDEADPYRATDWCCLANAPNVAADSQGAMRLLSTKPTGWRLSTYGPSRVSSWPAYTFSATGHALTTNAAAALLVRNDGTAAIRVIVTRTRARVVLVGEAGGTTEIAQHNLPPADTHSIRVTVTPAGTTAVVGGIVIAQLGPHVGPPNGGIGLGLNMTENQTEPWFDDVAIAFAFR
jgi:biofilm PGA synthesis lipoprotein PgaB